MCFLQHHVSCDSRLRWHAYIVILITWTFPLAGSGHHSSESMSGIALHRGHRAADPKRCSSAALVGSAFQSEVGHRTSGAHKGWPLRTLLMLKDNIGNFVFYMCPFLYGWVGHMMEVHCSGSGHRQARGTTTTAHLHFLHRCILGVVRTSLRVVTVERLGSRRLVQPHGRACERLHGGSRTKCSKTQGEPNSLLQTFDGLGGGPRVAELGPEGEDEPDLGLDEETGTIVDRGSDDERSPDPR